MEFWRWSTSSAANPIHTYTSEGTYNLSLTITDNEGAIVSIMIIANINKEDDDSDDHNDDGNNGGGNFLSTFAPPWPIPV